MAVQFQEEPIPSQQMVNFYVSGWYGTNNIDGGANNYEMVESLNQSMDCYPYSSPCRDSVAFYSAENSQVPNTSGKIIKSFDVNSQVYPYHIVEQETNGTYTYVIYMGNSYQCTSSAFPNRCTQVLYFNDKFVFFPYNIYVDITKSPRTFENQKQPLYFYLSDYVYTPGHGEHMSYYSQRAVSPYIVTDNVFDTYTVKVKFNDLTSEDIVVNNGIIRMDIKISAIAYNPNDLDDYKNLGGVTKDNIAYNSEKSKFTDTDFVITYTKEQIDYSKYSALQIKVNGYAYNYDCKTDVENLINGASFKLSVADNNVPKSLININYADVYNNRVVTVFRNVINVSALGETDNFSIYTSANGETDESAPFTTDVESGDFIAVKTFSNYCILFQADKSFVLSGNYAPFTLTSLGNFGCCSQSAICECQGVLYWLSNNGVVRYSGGYPTVISDKLGIDFNTIFSGAYSNSRIHMISDNKNVYMYDLKTQKLYVYYVKYESWQIEDLAFASSFFKTYKGELLYCTYNSTNVGNILKLHGANTYKDAEFKTRKYNFMVKERKNVSRVWLRLKMEAHSQIEIWMRADDGNWNLCAYYEKENETVFDFKKKIRKFDYVQFMFKTKGNVQIMDLTAKITLGTARHRVGKNLVVYKS